MCENCCVHTWNRSENILVSISIIIMKKTAEGILFSVFISKIINSFPYAMALVKSMSHNMEINPVQVSMLRATLWKIN